MYALPVISIYLVLGGIAILSLFAYIHEYNLRKKAEKESNNFISDYGEKSWEVLHDSIRKSQQNLGQAELESIKIVADSRVDTRKMEEEYNKKLDQTLEQSQSAVAISQTQFTQFLNNLQTSSQNLQQESLKITQSKINALFDNLEQRLSDFLVETSQKTTSSIELEIKAAKSLIETYKQGQIKVIDENILAILEQTLSIVLNKKLSLADQLDLIYEALEKAKVEKFII